MARTIVNAFTYIISFNLKTLWSYVVFFFFTYLFDCTRSSYFVLVVAQERSVAACGM